MFDDSRIGTSNWRRLHVTRWCVVLGDDYDNGDLVNVWISYLAPLNPLRRKENEEVEDEEVEKHISVKLSAMIPDIDKIFGKSIER